MTEHPTVIIGSGFAGAVAAAELTAAGLHTVLLERGPWRDTAPVRKMGIERTAPLPTGRHFFSHLLHRLNHRTLPANGLTLNRRGVYDIQLSKDIAVISTNQVGGGSHVYGGLNMRPACPGYWDGHHSGVTSQMMEPHYDYVLKRMGSSSPRFDAHYPNMFAQHRFTKQHFVTDRRAQDLVMGIDFSKDMGDRELSSMGMLGSPTGTKTTVDTVFLREALQKGLKLHDMCEVTAIYREDRNSSTSYHIKYRDHYNRCNRSITTGTLILAAGTINTLKLLLLSRGRYQGLQGMITLGEHLSGNGDYTALWRHPDSRTNLSEGLPVRGRIQLSDSSLWRSSNPWPEIVEGSLPYSGQLPRLLSKLSQNTTLLAGMGDDNAVGKVRYKKNRVVVEYDAKNAHALEDLRRAFDLIASLSGTRVTHVNTPVTVHPLGGARLGASPQNGVVNHQGEIFDHPGLYIADGAALPGALGTPPSISIAAWARHVSQGIIHSATNQSSKNAK